MAKKVNERERTHTGCYGSIVTYQMLNKFLSTNFQLNELADKQNMPRFAQCIWGHSGLGKTSLVKQFKNIPVMWNGKEYAGYDIREVPVAQFEEMGDLHGIPMDAILMRSEGKEQWIPQREQTILAFKEKGWEIDTNVQPRTIMAPPDWVPLYPGPSILLLDDWNRASVRIIKGIMQLLQNYGMVSWSLPHGCNIVLTGNPDEQDYLVTSIDSAILTRIKHITLEADAKEWAVWATEQELDPRGISFILYDPDMLVGNGAGRTNPRTLSELFRYTKFVENIEAEKEEVSIHANSLVDEETVAAFITFCVRDMEDVIEPEEILDGDKSVPKRIEKLMKRKEPRTDILGVICNRLYAKMVQEKTEMTKQKVKAFQEFVTMDTIPEDMRHIICRRLSKNNDGNGRNHKWLIGNDVLREQILSTLR